MGHIFFFFFSPLCRTEGDTFARIFSQKAHRRARSGTKRKKTHTKTHICGSVNAIRRAVTVAGGDRCLSEPPYRSCTRLKRDFSRGFRAPIANSAASAARFGHVFFFFIQTGHTQGPNLPQQQTIAPHTHIQSRFLLLFLCICITHTHTYRAGMKQ